MRDNDEDMASSTDLESQHLKESINTDKKRKVRLPKATLGPKTKHNDTDDIKRKKLMEEKSRRKNEVTEATPAPLMPFTTSFPDIKVKPKATIRNPFTMDHLAMTEGGTPSVKPKPKDSKSTKRRARRTRATKDWSALADFKPSIYTTDV